ncbi:MAG: 1-deoxy-D-xylulose-5-phosphate synthase, partial [Nanoarchaeota archaeon]
LNNLGYLKTDMLIVLNDNNMSISPSTGAISNYLKKASAYYPEYLELRKDIEEVLKKVSPLNILQKKLRLNEIIRPLISPGALFDELGIRYYGPVDGHNISELISVLRHIKEIKCPVILHTLTQKGKGYVFAERDENEKLHGMTPFNITNGEKYKKQGVVTYTEIFSETMIRLAHINKNIVVITAAMKIGTGLKNFEKVFPNRFFDVGIAEQHAVTFAGGLARDGLLPVCAIYSTFLQRAYDQIVHDICLQNLPVIFAIDRAGLVGEDGATHQGSFDIAYLRMLPNMVVMVPKDENELQDMLYTATLLNNPCAVRYPRGSGIGVALEQSLREIEIGKAEIIRRGKDKLAIIGIGPVLYDAIKACDELKISATIVNARFVKPIDNELINDVVSHSNKVILIEEGVLNGGFCSAVIECLERRNRNKNIKVLGIPDIFIEHATQSIQRDSCGLSKGGIKRAIGEMLNNR